MTSKTEKESLKKKIKPISWMFFDVDGVLTDGSLYYGPNGETLKRFNALDGHGIKLLFSHGINVGLISGRDHPATRVRADELGIKNLMMGTENKLKAFNKWAFDHSIDPKLCGHMGDDLPDAALFKKVGFSASVPNAPENIKLAADYVSEKAGGKGAVREIVELILKVKKEYA